MNSGHPMSATKFTEFSLAKAHLSFLQQSVRVGAVPQGRPKIAQHFSAGSAMVGRTKSRQGRPIQGADDSVVPAGLAGGIAAYPALKCWAILSRPSGTATTVPRRCKKLRCARLPNIQTHTPML